MNFDCIRGENIKITFVDDFDVSNDFAGRQCFVEIIIKKSKLKNILEGNDSQYSSQKSLTQREIQVLEYLAAGMNNIKISKELHISIHTTKIHIHSILSKLCVGGRTEAVVEAIRQNLIQI